MESVRVFSALRTGITTEIKLRVSRESVPAIAEAWQMATYLQPPSVEGCDVWVMGQKSRKFFGMLRFILTHPRILAFGVLLTLFSSFGQTFIISIFVPQILETFSLGTGEFGLLYAAATLTGAATLPFFGRLIDRMPLRRFSLLVGLGLGLACISMGLSGNVAMLFISVVGLRLTGQGLLSLTASTTMARVFQTGRGKALSVSSMGYPLGEGLLPLLIVLMIHLAGWRNSWLLLGGAILILLLPAMYSLVGAWAPTQTLPSESKNRDEGPRPLDFFRDPKFYLLLPSNLFLPLVLTALFLYQIPLADSRGWSASTMAAAFVGFAVSRMVLSFSVGPLIDRFSAVKILPFLLIPAFLGLVALLTVEAGWAAFVYLILVGASQGIAGPIMTATWAEVYGIESLGTTKSMVATFGVVSTAIGPLLLGFALSAGVGFDHVIITCLGAALVCSGAAVYGSRLLSRGMTRI